MTDRETTEETFTESMPEVPMPNDTAHDMAHGAAPDEPSAGPTWEDDETAATFILRAVAALLIGGFLAWSQHQSPSAANLEWGRWIRLSVAANFVLPLGVIWLFFGQGIVYLHWLKDQRSNAWNYGWSFANWRRHLKMALLFSGIMLVAMVIFRLTPAGHKASVYYKTGYFPPMNGFADYVMLLATLTLYMFCWEFFFRGFMLFGMAQGFGPVIAIGLQAAIFGWSHIGKPPVEVAGAFAGGLILGTVCWKEKSYAPAFYTHAMIHVAWAILVFL
jgi:membrane protease YdiL (CAAX protease family)